MKRRWCVLGKDGSMVAVRGKPGVPLQLKDKRTAKWLAASIRALGPTIGGEVEVHACLCPQRYLG